MAEPTNPLEPALYLVATPIGAARDITLRGLDVLAAADILVAEDTRNTRRLLDLHGVRLNGRPLIAYHDHNGPAQRPRLIRLLEEGNAVAYVSDAGTPLIADPGFQLVRDAVAAGIRVVAVPGASALLTALTVAGLPTDRFFFAGFLPPRPAARRKLLAAFADIPATLVFYENPRRVGESLRDMAQTLGGDRQAALCRELTKKFEEVRRASLAELALQYETDPPRGEVVLLVGPAPERPDDPQRLEDALKQALEECESLKDAVDSVAKALDLPRKQVYQQALELSGRK